MLELLIVLRDMLFAMLMSWAGMTEEDPTQKHNDDALSQKTMSAPLALGR